MENYEINGYKIRIEQDEDALTPDEAENTDVFLIAGHRSFTVKRDGFPLDTEKMEGYHYLPLYAYIHSGVSLSLGREGQFSCQWDSCQVGWVIIADTVGAHLAGKESMRRRVAQALVDEWNQYLSGDVWWVQILDRRGDEVESCGGFYGLDNAKEWARIVAQERDKSEEWTEREAIEYLRSCLKNLKDLNLIKGDNDHIDEVDWCLEKTEYWSEKEAK